MIEKKYGTLDDSSRIIADAQRADVCCYRCNDGGEKYIGQRAESTGGRTIEVEQSKLTRHGGHRAGSDTVGVHTVIGNL